MNKNRMMPPFGDGAVTCGIPGLSSRPPAHPPFDEQAIDWEAFV